VNTMPHPTIKRLNGRPPPESAAATPADYGTGDETCEDPDAYDEDAIWWTELPPRIADVARLGLVHTEAQCPVMILRVRDTGSGGLNEITGPPEDLLALATAIVNANRQIACFARGAMATAEVSRAAG